MNISLDWIDFLLAAGLWMAAAAYLLRRRSGPQERIAARLQQVVNQRYSTADDNDGEAPAGPGRAWRQRLIDLGNRVTLFNREQRGRLARLLIQSGRRNPSAVPLLVAQKLIAGGGLAVLSLLVPLPAGFDSLVLRTLLTLGMFMFGMIGPEYRLKLLVAARLRQIEQTLPDALDLMVICTNAGFSLSACLQRCGEELSEISPPLADEMTVTYNELQLSGDNATALRNMAERIGTQSIRSMVVTLLQSQQYGTPITQALRQLARTERAMRMLRLEEQAAKLSTKITFPMILFILPAVVIVSVGPALMNLFNVMNR